MHAESMDLGKKLTASSAKGGTPELHRLIKENNIAAVQALLEKGESAASVDAHGNTALHIAVRAGSVPAVRALLAAKANVNQVNKRNETALMTAADAGALEIVNLLLSVEDIDVNLATDDGTTALSFANSKGYSEVIKALEAKGAKIIESEHELMLNSLVTAEGKLDEAKARAEIEKIDPIGSFDGHGYTILHNVVRDAAEANDEGEKEKYAKYLTLINIILSIAAERKQDILNLTPRRSDGEGWTAAKMAEEFCLGEILGVLNPGVEYIKSGSLKRFDPAAALSGSDKDNPLQKPCSKEALDKIKAWVADGGSIYTVDSDHNTFLHMAAAEGDVEFIKNLLVKEEAKKADFIKWCNKKSQSALHVAAMRGQVAALALLLEQGATVDEEMANGATALMTAAQNGHVKAVRFLLAQGANPHQTEKVKGLTSLILAAQSGSLDVVNVLIAAGADVNQVNTNGVNALMAAVEGGHAAVVDHLLSVKGVNVNQTRVDGATALSVAEEKGDKKIAAALRLHKVRTGTATPAKMSPKEAERKAVEEKAAREAEASLLADIAAEEAKAGKKKGKNNKAPEASKAEKAEAEKRIKEAEARARAEAAEAEKRAKDAEAKARAEAARKAEAEKQIKEAEARARAEAAEAEKRAKDAEAKARAETAKKAEAKKRIKEEARARAEETKEKSPKEREGVVASVAASAAGGAGAASPTIEELASSLSPANRKSFFHEVETAKALNSSSAPETIVNEVFKHFVEKEKIIKNLFDKFLAFFADDAADKQMSDFVKVYGYAIAEHILRSAKIDQILSEPVQDCWPFLLQAALTNTLAFAENFDSRIEKVREQVDAYIAAHIPFLYAESAARTHASDAHKFPTLTQVLTEGRDPSGPYMMTGVDIDAILKPRIDEANENLKNNRALTQITVGSIMLSELRKKLLELAGKLTMLDPEATSIDVYIPINLSNTHWVSGRFKFECKDGSFVVSQATFVDSLASLHQQTEEFINIIRKLNPACKIELINTGEQKDGFRCGDYVCRELLADSEDATLAGKTGSVLRAAVLAKLVAAKDKDKLPPSDEEVLTIPPVEAALPRQEAAVASSMPFSAAAPAPAPMVYYPPPMGPMVFYPSAYRVAPMPHGLMPTYMPVAAPPPPMAFYQGAAPMLPEGEAYDAYDDLFSMLRNWYQLQTSEGETRRVIELKLKLIEKIFSTPEDTLSAIYYNNNQDASGIGGTFLLNALAHMDVSHCHDLKEGVLANLNQIYIYLKRQLSPPRLMFLTTPGVGGHWTPAPG